MISISSGCMSSTTASRPELELLRDPSGKLTLAEVRDLMFKPVGSQDVNIGYDDATYWLRMCLRAEESDRYILAVSRELDFADLFVERSNGQMERHRSGDRLPLDARDFPVSAMAFRVALTAGEPVTVYLRSSSSNSTLLTPRLYTIEAFAIQAQATGVQEGIFYGIMLTLVGFNVLLFIGLRDRVQYLYIIFQVGFLLMQAALDKMPVRLRLPDAEGWSRHLEIVAAGLTTIGAIGFARALLATRTHMPRMDFVLRATAIVMLGMVATGICSASMIIQEVGVALVMSCCTLLLAAGIVAVAQSIRNSGVFLTGWAVLLGGSVIAAMDAGGFLNDRTVGYYAPKIGAVVEATVLSIGLALRVYRLRRDKERAQRDVLLERAARADFLEHLVGGVSHEIGNPLNFIVGGASALAATLPQGDRSRRALTVVEQGAQRIKRIVENLRTYSSARDVALGTANVGKEIQSILELFSERFARQRICPICAVGDAPDIDVRLGELGQVLTNVITNACDAMPNGGSLRIACSVDADSVQIIVADSGPGVPIEARRAIFDPFFTTREHGTGLGLSVSSQIARRHGGELHLLDPGDPLAGGLGGAAFVLKLPRGDGGTSQEASS
jgi:signal transduction histidine kinase